MSKRPHAPKRAVQISTNSRTQSAQETASIEMKENINANKEDRDDLHELKL